MRFFLRRFCCCCLAHTLWTIPWSAQSSFQSDPASFVPRCCFFFFRVTPATPDDALRSPCIYISFPYDYARRGREGERRRVHQQPKELYILYTLLLLARLRSSSSSSPPAWIIQATSLRARLSLVSLSLSCSLHLHLLYFTFTTLPC